MQNGNTSDESDFYEFSYPFTIPQFDLIDILSENDAELAASRSRLTPLEYAFTAWWLETRSPREAYICMQDPRQRFTPKIGPVQLSARPTIREIYSKIRRSQPYQRLYNRDTIMFLLHRELRQVSADVRIPRWKNPTEEMVITLGKRSIFDAESAEAERCLKIIAMIASLNGDNLTHDTTSSTFTSGQDSRIDRVIAQAEALITGREIGPAIITESGD